MFILIENNSKKYFVNPSYERWDFSVNKKDATIFKTIEEANSVAESVNRASSMTYWDYSDTPPEAIVIQV